MRTQLLALCLTALPLWADETNGTNTEENEPAGFITELVNNVLERAAEKKHTEKNDTLHYGRDVTRWASVPKLGGYYIATYKYSSQEGAHGGDGFGSRLGRLYVDGTLLRDFNYRVQLEYQKTVHLKDAYVEWAHYRWLRVKMGQFKRIFTFENPYNPWDVGVGDYSLTVKKLSGFSDYSYSEYNGSNGGRDMGLQLQGDLLAVGKDKHPLLHYQVGVFNGQGINTTDANAKKDWMGTLQVQPVRGLYVGVFGWKGTLTANNVTVERNRWAVGAKYERDGWSARAEYIHHTGHKVSDWDSDTRTWSGNARADGWYATAGFPCTRWLKTYVKYETYRDGATWSNAKSIYSLCPNFQLHKNLMIQVQYNFVNDKTASDNHYHELWAQTYFRF